MVPGVLWQLVRGFCMGAADIVPGVSGGTVALLFGIYERLVDNVQRGARALGVLVRGNPRMALGRLRDVEWGFLMPLLVGIGLAIIALASLIEQLLEDYPEEMAGLFLGLVAASVVVASREVETWTGQDYTLAAVVSVVTFFALGFQSGAVSDPTLLAYFGAGAIAICAMILPGISGSFLLLMMGMYAPVLGAVNDRDLLPLLVFAVGAVVGLALFSTLLHSLLRSHGDLVLAALVGLMIGSVRVLWPWPNGVGIISEEEEHAVKGTSLEWPESFSDFLWPTLLAVASFLVVLAVAHISRRNLPERGPLTVGAG